MKFLHINKTEIAKSSDRNSPIRELNDDIDSGKDVFILIYMEGCGPCNEMRPEWKKIENIFLLKKNNPKYKNVVIADMDNYYSDRLRSIKEPPNEFPTIKYISKKGTNIEDFENSDIPNKERKVDAFMDWINSKVNNNTTTNQEGGKWSQKYKSSINCRRPKGFSQKQHCKYGRKSKRKSKRKTLKNKKK